jgi:SagB-type dehydrogenase family enzyme
MNRLKSPIVKTQEEVIDPYCWPKSTTIKLTPHAPKDQQSFVQVLDNRRSKRNFKIISPSELGKLLYLSNRTRLRERNSVNIMVESRPVVSAGGLHTVDCLVLFPEQTSWRRYNAFNHSLECLCLENYLYSDLVKAARNFFPDAHNAALIWYVGDTTRISAKYENAESLLWRDAGAIIATQSLVAEYLGYSFCPIGLTGGTEAKNLSSERQMAGLGLSFVGL